MKVKEYPFSKHPEAKSSLPSISILTPVYNGERFIENCIQNVIQQGVPDLEHWVIDGGSTDRTMSIVKKYANQYSHLKWISEPDRGQSDAMNKGIALARAAVISFLNVDDYYEPDTLSFVIKAFEKLPEPSFLVGNTLWRDEEERVIKINKPRYRTLAKMLFYQEYPHNPSAYFYHKSLHERIGGYDTDLQDVLDMDFIFRAVPQAKVIYVNKNLGNFRFIPGTKSFENTFHNEESRQIYQDIFAKYEQSLSSVGKRELKKLRAWKFLKGQSIYFSRRSLYYLSNPLRVFSFLWKKARK